MIFGKRLSEYVEFCKVFLILIAATGLLRLALSLGGVPNSTVRWFSVSALIWIGVLYYAVRVHARGFGGYKQLLVITVLLNLTAQVIIISGIVLAIFTGTDNIFSAPEYAFGSDGKTWLHAGAHLTVGTVAGSLVPWLMGSLVLLVTKKLTGSNSRVKSAAY
jgi:hypothetical protein